MVKQQQLNVELIELNTGQLYGLPSNPRFIKDSNFDKLVKSIKEDETFLQARGILVYRLESKKYIIIGGEMRFRACLVLGFKEVPCIILPASSSIDSLRKYSIIDNSHAGQFDFEALANEFNAAELSDWFLEVPVTEEDVEAPKVKALPNYHIEYKLVFDHEGHQEKFYRWLGLLKEQYPECETVSERINQFLEESQGL